MEELNLPITFERAELGNLLLKAMLNGMTL